MKMFKLWVMGLCANLGMLSILMNQRGEAGAAGDGDKGDGGAGDGDGDKGDGGAGDAKITMTQAQLDATIQGRLSRQKEHYKDYDDLKKYHDDAEKNKDSATQKDLESKQEYDKLKDGWATKENEYKGVVSSKDQEIKDLRIDHALGAELSKNNAQPDALYVIKPLIMVGEDGMPYIPGKDSNNLDIKMPLDQGVKKMLEERPYLVKAGQNNGGGGSPPAGGSGGGGEGTETLTDLNTQYATALAGGNAKLSGELRVKINNYFSSKNINRII